MDHETRRPILNASSGEANELVGAPARSLIRLERLGAWIPIVVFGVFAMATLLLWQAIERQQARYRAEWLNKEAHILADQIEQSAQEYIQAFSRIGKRWDADGGTDRRAWERDAENYLKDFPALQAIEWVDSTNHVRWVAPIQGNEAAVGLNLAFEGRRAEALKQAREQNTAVFGRVVELVQGGNGLLLFVPLSVEGKDDGFILAVLRPDVWLNGIIAKHHDPIGFAIYDRDVELSQSVRARGVQPALSQTVDVDLAGVAWRVEAWPDPSVTPKGDPISSAVLYIGSVLTLTLTLLSFLVCRVYIHRSVLREAQHRLSLVVDGSSDGVWDWVDVTKDRMWWSPACYQLIGHEPGEVAADASTAKQLIHPADLNYVMNSVQEHLDHNEVFDVECRIRCRTGEYRWVSLRGRAVRTLNSTTVRMAGAVSDITGRKNAENLLQEYRAALDSSAIVAITDRAGTITYVNDKFCEISKYDRLELLGNNHRLLNSGYHPRSYFQDMYDTLARDGIWRGEICNCAKDGSIYWVDTTIVAFHDSEGRIEQYMAIRADITARKSAESRLIQSNRELEEKTHEMEQFTYSVSHDLKSPLFSCAGLVNCIEEDVASGDTEQVYESIRRTRDNIMRMEQCIEDLLNLSRVGMVRHEPVKLDIAEAARRVVDGLGTQIQEKHANVRIAEDMPVVTADPVRVNELLENLISNALKYGCGVVSCEIEIGWSNHDDVACYFVRDNGPGIPEKYHEKVFGLFQRVDTSTKGTGVGLAIVKRIMQVHGGDIWLGADVGRGTTFWFTFSTSPGNEFRDALNAANQNHPDIEAKSA